MPTSYAINSIEKDSKQVTTPDTRATNEVSNPDADRGEHRDRSISKVRGSVISFHDINYTVRVSDSNKICGRVDKEILSGVSGIFRPGMNAIMGPTGGGKSSLLDVLAGRKDPVGLSGTVLVDGLKQPENFKCMTGYVVQDDVIMGTLTVRENLLFSANLRIKSGSLGSRQKDQLVEEILEELGLLKCADSRVGTEYRRGVSGGERKRTAIGMELITSPCVLFLDEPTTGLDASTANAVMSLLHVLSRRGRTIIFSIHQPRYGIFNEFDTLMLLTRGRPAYHGPATEGLEFFSELGYQCEPYNNPPDFFLDVLTGDTAITEHKDNDHENKGNNDAANTLEVAMVTGRRKNLMEFIVERYKSSRWHMSIRAQLEPIWKKYETSKKKNIPQHKGGYQTTFLTQFGYLSRRSLINLVRNIELTMMQVITMIFLALVVGLIYLQLGLSYPYDIQNRTGAFFFIIQTQMFITISALDAFIYERKIFIHESISGFYRVSAYFCSKILCDIIPIRIIPATAYAMIAYFMMGLVMEPTNFFIFYLTLILTTMAASAIAFAVSATFGLFAISNILTTMIFILMVLFGGVLVNIPDMADWMRWLQYLSIVRYGVNALSINEFKNQIYYRSLENLNNTTIPLPDAGNNHLKEQGIAYTTAWDLWQNIMTLGLMAVGIMIIAYVQLRRIKKYT